MTNPNTLALKVAGGGFGRRRGGVDLPLRSRRFAVLSVLADGNPGANFTP